MPDDPDVSRIILDRLRKEIVRNAFPILGDVLIGIREDLEAAEKQRDSLAALDDLRKQIDAINQLLNNPNVLELFQQLKTRQPFTATSETGEFDKIITNLLDGLNDPFGATLDPKSSVAIETQTSSKGRLVSTNRINENLLVRIGDLKSGKLFYPLHFIRENLVNLDQWKEIVGAPPLQALFDPPVYDGYPKWICVEFENNVFAVSAYPKPIEVNSTRTGRPKQLDRFSIDKTNPVGRFEYWPQGDGEPKFIVEMILADVIRLNFQKKGSTNTATLQLEFIFTDA